ncbi:MAG TPA: hypothetical protein VF905_09235, partial [Nitrospirota bacterium]
EAACCSIVFLSLSKGRTENVFLPLMAHTRVLQRTCLCRGYYTRLPDGIRYLSGMLTLKREHVVLQSNECLDLVMSRLLF